MEDFSYDLIESSQYMQHARDLDPNLALFVGSFFFPHDRMASKFSGICLRERERERARARSFQQGEGERQREKAGSGGCRAVRHCERLPCSIVGFHIIFKEASCKN
jgi:hypothetical protein